MNTDPLKFYPKHGLMRAPRKRAAWLCDLPDDDLKLLDQTAQLSLAGNGALDELRSLYLQDMRLRVPPVVKSWYVEDEEKYRLEELFGRELSLVKYL
jgi:hypothetical protein